MPTVGSAPRPSGVSVIVCCHNSAERLPATLAHLAAQKIRSAAWEVIVVNNGSTDQTVNVAKQSWPDRLKPFFRILDEPKLGLTYARRRGLDEAKYEYVCYVDDDNWICETWIEDVLEIMSRYPDTAVCGGVNAAVADEPLPWWFDCCKAMYAISDDQPPTGDITDLGVNVCGAGFTLRLSAVQSLHARGFEPILSGRTGASLVSNEDNELCYALKLAGWRLRIDPRLRLQHYLPASRLTWTYAQRLHRAAGLSGIALDAYFFGAGPRPGSAKKRLRQTWQWQAASLLKGFLCRPLRVICSSASSSVGQKENLAVNLEIGRFLGLLQHRGSYSRYVEKVRRAGWWPAPVRTPVFSRKLTTDHREA